MSDEIKPVDEQVLVSQETEKPAEETPGQIAAKKKHAELVAQKEARIKAAAELKAKREELKSNVGKSFTDGEREGKVVAFDADKMLGSQQGDTFLVNFGNPNRSDFYFCETFLATFKPKE